MRRKILQIFSFSFLMIFLNTEADSVTPSGSRSFRPGVRCGTMNSWLGILAVWGTESTLTRTGDPNGGNRGTARQGFIRERKNLTVPTGNRFSYLRFCGTREISFTDGSASRGSLICSPISCSAFPYCPQYSRARAGVCSYFSKQARYDFRSKVASL